MMKLSRLLAIAGLVGTLLTGAAFAQSSSGGAMSSGDHMTSAAMSPMKSEHKSSGAMMAGAHGKMSSGATASADHMKKSHMSSGAMTSGH